MTDDLAHPHWTPLTNNVAGTGGAVPVIDLNASGQPQRFYRVQQLP